MADQARRLDRTTREWLDRWVGCAHELYSHKLIVTRRRQSAHFFDSLKFLYELCAVHLG